MHRRKFCKTALAAGLTVALTGCDISPSGTKNQASSTINAITGAGNEVSIERAAVTELAESLQGSMYLPGDEAYDVVRKVWNGTIDKHPAMVVQCGSVNDVALAVQFAGQRNLLVAVKGGGHSFPGESTCDGGMMIDLSQMHGVDVDVDAKTARVAGGALLGHLDGAALPHNLVTTAGIVSHTGVGGFTLGGGMGRTDRLHGLAIDNLLAATVVTATGEVLRASDAENADLFWAIRGGSGNFGVATEFVYRLHPFNPSVYGANLFYSFDQARDFLHFYAEFNETLPDEASVEPQFVFDDNRGPVLMVEVCYLGDHAAGEQVMAPLVAFGKRLSGEFGAVSYQQMQTSVDAMLAHGVLSYLKSGYLIELTEASIDAMVGNFEGDHLPFTWFQHLGGASARIAPDETAYPHRNVRFNYGIMDAWGDPAESDMRIAAVRRYYKALEPHMKGFYTNLNDDTEKKTRGNFGDNYPRLVEVKNRYDPTNLFRLNANIQPTV